MRIDDLTSHYIDITVTELDINNVHLGQQVTITFDAVPLREYKGTIVNISNAGVVENLSVNFALTVKMEETDDSVKSGMMADVAIVTEQAEDTLYVPQQAISVAGDGITRVVQKLMDDGTYTEIPVTVGMTSGTNVQITSDNLNEGDEVRLNKVTSMMNTNMDFSTMFGSNMRTPGMGGGPDGTPGGRRR